MPSGNVSPSSRAHRRTQAERSRSTRAALLEAAIECVCASGYAATTTSDVARVAGLTRGAVQHHFQDRDELMASVVEHGWGDLARRLEGIADFEGTLRHRVSLVIDRMWESYAGEACRAAVEIHLATRADPERQSHYAALYREGRDTLDAEWQRLFSDAPASRERVRRCRRMARSALAGTLQQMALDSSAPSRVADDLRFAKEAVYLALTERSGIKW